MQLKTVHISIITRSSFRREFQSLGAATIKALSPYVFDRTVGIESKILPEDLRLYKDDLNVSKSHRYLGARPLPHHHQPTSQSENLWCN